MNAFRPTGERDILNQKHPENKKIKKNQDFILKLEKNCTFDNIRSGSPDNKYDQKGKTVRSGKRAEIPENRQKKMKTMRVNIWSWRSCSN